MTYFRYERVGMALFTTLADHLGSARSAVLLGPPNGGTRHAVQRVASLLREQRAGTVAVVDLDAGVRTMAQLADRMALASGFGGDGDDVFDAPDLHWQERKQPLLLLVPNLDALPHFLVQRFLQGVRVRVEERRLVVLLGGDQQFRDFVYGPNSEFNCSTHFVLQSLDREEFTALLHGFKAVLTFDVGPEAADALFESTAGQLLTLKFLLARAVELRAKGVVPHDRALSVEEAGAPRGPLSHVPSFLRRSFGRGEEMLRTNSSIWPDLERLQSQPEEGIEAPLEPGPLELSGLATRTPGHRLHFSSPLARSFVDLHYTPRRFADLYGGAGQWEEAFRRCEALDESQWVRPQTADDRPVIEQVLHALETRLASQDDARRVFTEFQQGARFLLGFPEVSLWRRDSSWEMAQEIGRALPAEKREELARLLPPSLDNRSRLLDVPEPWRRFALVATLRSPGRDHPEVLCLSDMRQERSLSRDRLLLARNFFQAFLSAYDHAGEIQFLRDQIALQKRHVAILDSILDTVGVSDMDRSSICRRVAQELRPLGYRRVLLCLVDRHRRRIEGVWDDSDQPDIDIARLTSFALDDPSDCQPQVIRTGEPFVTSNASLERLANPKVYGPAGQRGLAIVPIVDRDGDAIGTIHVERTDGARPSAQEVSDLQEFGRRLGPVLAHAERATLLNRSLDRISEPVAVLDPSFRWRYANEAAAKVLQVPAGWQTWRNGVEIAANDPVEPFVRRAMDEGEPGVDRLSASQVTAFRSPDDSFHIMTAPLRDAAREINGAFVHLREYTNVQSLVNLVGRVVRCGAVEPAIQTLLQGLGALGHPESRIYRVEKHEAELRLLSYRAVGMDPDSLRLFNHRGFALAPRDGRHHSWQCIEQRRGVIFVWSPRGRDGETVYTTTGLQAVVVNEPEYCAQLGKEPECHWIDLPLFSADGEPLGKLSTAVPADLGAQQFWILQLLASLVSAVLETLLQQRWIEEGYEKSLATISHHLMNRVIVLEGLRWRFANAERNPSKLPEVNRDFRAVLRTITATIRRARDFLRPPQVKPAPFDLLELCRSLVATHLSDDGGRSILGRIVCESNAMPVVADSELIADAFCEILTNARKALRLHPDPEFCLWIGQGDARVTVLFANNGPPVPYEDRENIFEDFYSSWPLQNRSTGLGLGWVRRVMRAHRGEVVLDEYGAGARFRVTLPLKEAE